MSPFEALRQCIEAMKLVDFKDCAESEELWHKFNLAQANAERVLRDDKESEIWHVQQLRAAAADPMWGGHAEVSKSLLAGAANIIEAAAARVSKLKAEAVLRDGKKQEPAAWGILSDICAHITQDKELGEYWARKGRNVTPLYTHPAPSLQAVGEVPNYSPLFTRIDEAIENYVRHGSICEFEGQPMIYAATLLEIGNLLGEVAPNKDAAPQPAAAPSGNVKHDASLYPCGECGESVKESCWRRPCGYRAMQQKANSAITATKEN